MVGPGRGPWACTLRAAGGGAEATHRLQDGLDQQPQQRLIVHLKQQPGSSCEPAAVTGEA